MAKIIDLMLAHKKHLTLIFSILLFVFSVLSFSSGEAISRIEDCVACPVPLNIYIGTVLLIGCLINLLFYVYPQQTEKNIRKIFFVILFFLIGVSILSPEIFMTDSYEHFLISKYAISHPELFLNQWNKPFFTILTFLAAQLGLLFVRLINVVLAIGTIIVVEKIAKKIGLSFSYFTAALMLGAPFFLILSTSVLTELSMAFFLSLAILFFVQGKKMKASLVFSALPFFRSEGLVVLIIFALYFLIKKEFKPFLVIFSIPLIMNLIGFLVTGQIFWIFTSNPYMVGNFDAYPLNYFWFFIPLMVGPISVGPFLTGLFYPKKNELMYLLSAIFLSLFSIYTLILFSGNFVNIIFIRVFISILPVIVLLILFGLSLLETKNSLKPILLSAIVLFPIIFFAPTAMQKIFAIIAFFGSVLWVLPIDKRSLLLIGILISTIFAHPPQPLNPEHRYAKEASEFLIENNLTTKPIYSWHAAVYFFSGVDPYKNNFQKGFYDVNFVEGSIFVWDRHFGVRTVSQDAILNDSSWTKLEEIKAENSSKPFIIILQKTTPKQN